MSYSLTVEKVKEKYSTTISQFNISDDLIEIAIQDAYVELIGLIEHSETLTPSLLIDTTRYGEVRIETWWRELAYYYIFKAVESEKVAQDKYDDTLAQIEVFHKKRTSSSTYPSGFIVTAAEAILPEEDILAWGSK